MQFSDQRIAEELENEKFYFADKTALSNSMLGILDESPTKFDLFIKGEWSYPSQPYFDIGSAVHELFLEGVDNRIEVQGTRSTKAYKLAKQHNPDKYVLPSADFNLVSSMVDKLHKVPELTAFIGQFAEQRPELAATAILTTPSGNKIAVKGKGDMLLSDGFSSPTLLDLKTTAKSLADWKRNAWYGNYPRQAYMYSQLFQAEEFNFVVITKSFPYEVGIYRASPAFLTKGKRQFEESILRYEHLFIEGNYKPYSAQVELL